MVGEISDVYCLDGAARLDLLIKSGSHPIELLSGFGDEQWRGLQKP
jgi:hypothetical protein